MAESTRRRVVFLPVILSVTLAWCPSHVCLSADVYRMDDEQRIIAANWLSLTDGSSDTLTQYRQPHLRRGRMTAPAFSARTLSPSLVSHWGPLWLQELSVPAGGLSFQLSHCSQTTVWPQGSPPTGNVMGTTSTCSGDLQRTGHTLSDGELPGV